MKKIILTFLFFLLTTIPCIAKTLEFAIVSDTHITPSNNKTTFTQSEKNLIFTVNSINKKKDIKFVVFLGDNIDKSTTDSLVAFMNIVQNLEKPYYIVFGNHDAYTAGGIPKETYSKIVHHYNNHQPLKETSYNFKANKDSYGIVLDGSSYMVPGKHGRYTPELLKQTEKFIKSKKKSMIFIFQHFPLISPNDNKSHDTLDTQEFMKMIAENKNIVLIASGHFHHQKVTIDKNGIYHISAPALGARAEGRTHHQKISKDRNNNLYYSSTPAIGARASSSGSGTYEIIKIQYTKKLFMKPKNIKVEIEYIKI